MFKVKHERGKTALAILNIENNITTILDYNNVIIFVAKQIHDNFKY